VTMRAAQEILRDLGNVRCMDCGVHASPRGAKRHATGTAPATGRLRRAATVARARNGHRAN
jgi:hypothetical protein